MPRSKKVKAEIVRVAPPMDLAKLDALIQKRVAEATGGQGAIREPWFPSAALANEIRRHQSVFHRRKFRLYFERWGCMICHKKSVGHEAARACVGRIGKIGGPA